MNTSRWMSFAAMSVLMVGLLAVLVPTSPGQAPAAKPRVSWEYKTQYHPGGLAPVREMNELGQQGWELVGYSRLTPNESMFVFKRPL